MATDLSTVILIGGNRGAGKNTFAATLRGSKHESSLFRFDVFALSSLIGFTYPFETNPVYTELSFAHVLKESVAKKLGIPHEDVERLKDVPMSPEMLQSCESKHRWFQKPDKEDLTVRDVLIDEAASTLARNPPFYAKTVYEKHIRDAPSGKTFLITDWRYHHEYEYFRQFEKLGKIKIITIRIINENAPPVDTPSERNLDNFITQYVAVPGYQSASSVHIQNGAVYHYYQVVG
jgi:hypothetical protein